MPCIVNESNYTQTVRGRSSEGGTHTNSQAAEWPPKGVTIVTHSHTHTHSLSLSLSTEHDSGKLAKIYATGKEIPRKCRQFLAVSASDPGQEQSS